MVVSLYLEFALAMCCIHSAAIWWKLSGLSSGLSQLTFRFVFCCFFPPQSIAGLLLVFCFVLSAVLYPWLFMNWLCKPGWPWDHRHPPACAFWVMGLKEWDTVGQLSFAILNKAAGFYILNIPFFFFLHLFFFFFAWLKTELSPLSFLLPLSSVQEMNPGPR